MALIIIIVIVGNLTAGVKREIKCIVTSMSKVGCFQYHISINHTSIHQHVSQYRLYYKRNVLAGVVMIYISISIYIFLFVSFFLNGGMISLKLTLNRVRSNNENACLNRSYITGWHG